MSVEEPALAGSDGGADAAFFGAATVLGFAGSVSGAGTVTIGEISAGAGAGAGGAFCAWSDDVTESVSAKASPCINFITLEVEI